MNPVHPWLDPHEVKRLAEQLMRPAPTQETRIMDSAGLSTGFVGFTEPPSPADGDTPPGGDTTATTPQPIADLPQPIPLPPVSPGPQAAIFTSPIPTPVAIQISKPSPAPEPQTSTPSPIPEHIRPFRDWMLARCSASGLFLLDDKGTVIFDEGPLSRFHFLARSLMLAPLRPGAAASHVHIRIGVASIVEIIPMDTPSGRIALGALVSDPLGQDAIQQVMQELVRTLPHAQNPALGVP